MSKKKLATTIYITEKQQNSLKELNERLKIPISAMIRQGIDLILKNYEERLSGQISFPLFEEDKEKKTKKKKK